MNSRKKINIANNITYIAGALLCIIGFIDLTKSWYFNDTTIDKEARFVIVAMGLIIMFFSEASCRNNNLRNK